LPFWLRKEAAETSVFERINSVEQEYAPLFNDGPEFRRCQAEAYQSVVEHLRERRQETTTGYVPDLTAAQSPYMDQVRLWHNLVGFRSGFCLCFKRVRVRLLAPPSHQSFSRSSPFLPLRCSPYV
jgi:hypothetical protein